MLNDRMYNYLKYTTTMFLPGVSTLYFTVAQIWGFPKAEEVVGTIAAVSVFLGVLIGLSTKAYNKSDSKYDGTINVVDGEETKTYTLEFDHKDPDEISAKQEVLFKVNGQ